MSKQRAARRRRVWDRVLGAVDLTPASIQAARTAARMMPAGRDPDTVRGRRRKALGADHASRIGATREAQDRLTQAQAEIEAFHDAELHLREGRPIGRLLDELSAERATLVTVGRPGRQPGRRRHARQLTTAILHEAVCSVLIAGATERDYGEVVVGFDGSGGAGRALAVGRELAGAPGAALRVLVATGDAASPGSRLVAPGARGQSSMSSKIRVQRSRR